MKNLLIFMSGLFVGVVFRGDLPIIKNLDNTAIRHNLIETAKYLVPSSSDE